MRVHLKVFVVALLAVAPLAQPASAQIPRKPTSPLRPTDPQACTDLEAAWRVFRKEAGIKHDACFKELETGAHMDSNKDKCWFPQCQAWHGSFYFGSDEVRSCRDEVAAYQKELKLKRAREDSLKKEKESEKAKRDKDEAKEREEAAQRDAKEQEERDRDAATEKREADDRKAEERKEKAAADAAGRTERQQALKDAMDEQQKRRDRTMEANKRREAAQAALEKEQSKNSSALTRLVDGSVAAMDAAGRGLMDAIKNIGSTTPTTKSSDFDIAPERSRFETGMSTLFETPILSGAVLEAMIPYTSIPMALTRNAATNTLDLADQLGRAIDNFDSADPRDLEQAFAAFPEKALGPRALLGAIFDHTVAGAFDTFVMKPNIIDPLAEQIQLRTRLAMKDRSAGALFEEAETPGGTMHFWWERNTAPAKPMRDSRGTLMLYERGGGRFGYDANTGLALYDPSDIERLIARRDVHPRMIEQPKFFRKSAMVELTPTDPPWFLGTGSEWVAGQYGAQLNPAKERLKQVLLDRAAPERKP